MYCFRVFRSGGASRLISLQEPALTLGSAKDNDIVLDDASIPPLALRLAQVSGGYSIRAVDSRRRPLVNGVAADPARLLPGDRLEIGPFVLVLDVAGEAGEPETNSKTTIKNGMDVRASLARFCDLVAEERDLRALLEKAMRLLLETFSGDEALLFTLDGHGVPQVLVSTHPAQSELVFSDTVVREALKSRRGIRIENALNDPVFSSAKSIADLRLRSLLACPIRAAGKVSGLVHIGSKRPAVSFSASDLEDLEVYAMVLGCLIDNLAYIAEQNRVIASLRSGGGEDGVVAMCPTMKTVTDEVNAVADSDISVLLQGETGTGKDVIARLLHARSRRRAQPFLVVNCSTLRGDLLASELFGHKKGSFTGAVADQKGLFLAADGGTLFLDEIGEMESALQASLLRVLESGMIRPVGHASEIPADVRIICATNRDLSEMISQGTFRKDLYYRINQHVLHLPPLRDRGEDILILAQHFLQKYRAQYPGKKIEGFHPESLAALMAYPWPGNVRELANAVHKGILFATTPAVRLAFPEKGEAWIGFDEATRRFQQDYVRKSLIVCGGDKDKAAAMLGMGRSTFFRHLAQARIDDGDQ